MLRFLFYKEGITCIAVSYTVATEALIEATYQTD